MRAALGPSAGLQMTSLPGVTTLLPVWDVLGIRFLTSFWRCLRLYGGQVLILQHRPSVMLHCKLLRT